MPDAQFEYAQRMQQRLVTTPEPDAGLMNDPFLSGLRRKEPANSDATVAKWEIDPKDHIDEIRHLMLGELWDAKKQTWYTTEYSRALMNEYGVEHFCMLLTQYTAKIITLSNYEKEELIPQVLKTMFSINKDLFCGYRDYNLDPANFDMVMNLLRQPIYATFLRAKGQGERIYRRMIQSWNESTIQRDQPMAPRKPSFFRRVFGGG